MLDNIPIAILFNSFKEYLCGAFVCVCVLPHGTSLTGLVLLSVIIHSSHDDTCVTPPGALWAVAMVTATG